MVASRRLAVVNMKGGVGKTTTAVSVASGFARAGRRVLLVDGDPQGNVSHLLALTPTHTLRDVMLGEVPVEDALLRDVRPGLDVLPSTPAAFALDAQLAGAMQRETLLSRRLAPLNSYDVVVFDTSPAMNLLAYNALLCATELVVPLAMDTLSLMGARQTLDGVREIRTLWPDRRLELSAVIPTAVQSHTHATRGVLAALSADAEMGPVLVQPGVRQCIDLVYAAAAHQTIWEYAPRSRAADDYRAVLRHLDPDAFTHETSHATAHQTTNL